MAALPTLSPTGQDIAGGWTDEAGGTTNLHLLIDEAVGSPGTDYIRGALNAGTNEGRFDITNMPADFDTLLTLTISCRHSRGTVEAGSASGDDTGVLRVIIRDASDVALSDVVTIYDAGGGGYLARTETGVSITGLVDTSNQTRWDGAKVCISTTFTKVKGNDGHYTWVDAVNLGGTYTPAAAATYDETGRATTITSTVTVTDVLTAPALTQSAFRIRSDDSIALNTDSGWEDALNTSPTSMAVIDRAFRIRFQITASLAPGATTYELWYAKNGGAYAIVKNNANTFIASGGSGNQWEVQLAPSTLFTDGDNTTELLAGSGTFVAGDGVSAEPSDSITLTNTQDTELEFNIVIRKLSNDGHVTDGDYFDFRVRESDGTVLDAYDFTPRVTIGNRAGQIGGSAVETPQDYWIIDKSDNFYYMGEYTDAGLGTNDYENTCVMMKSTDGGLSWNPQDWNPDGGPGLANNDVEAGDMHYVAADDTIYIAHQGDTNDDVKYVEFYTEDHATLADTWGTVELVDNTVLIPGDSGWRGGQGCAIRRRSDGTTVIFYKDGNSTQDYIHYKIRSSGGTWDSSPTVLASDATNSFHGPFVEMDSNDDIHVFYQEVDNTTTGGLLWHKSLSSADSLSGASSVEGAEVLDGDTSNATWSMTPPKVYFDGAVEKVGIIFANENRRQRYTESPISSISFSTPENMLPTSNAAVEQGTGGSHTIVGSLVVDDRRDQLYTIFNPLTGEDLVYNDRSVGGTWTGTETTIESGAIKTEQLSWIRGRHFTRVGQKRIGAIISYEEDPGGTGGLIYKELLLAFDEELLATTITSTVAVTDTLGGGTTYDETLRATTITSTVALTDVLGMYELLLATTITSTDTITDVQSYVDLLATTIASTITLTDVLTMYELLLATTITSTTTVLDVVSYKELLLATDIASTVTVTDVIGWADPLLATTIASTVAGSDVQSYVDLLATTIASTITLTDVLDAVELLATTIVSTVAGTDAISYKELLLSTDITSTITLTDVLSAVEVLATNVVSTITLIDVASYVAEVLATVVASTIGLTDIQDYITEVLATTITSTVTVTDIQGYPEEILATVITSTDTVLDVLDAVELLLATTIASTVTVTDAQGWADLLLATTIASTVTVDDVYTPVGGYDETLRATVITSTTDATDTLIIPELLLATTINSTVNGTDVQSFVDLLATTIASTVTVLDALNVFELLLATTIASTVAGTDSQGYAESAQVTISSTLGGTDVQFYVDLAQINIVSTVLMIDAMDYTELLLPTTIISIIGHFETYTPAGFVPGAIPRYLDRSRFGTDFIRSTRQERVS